MEKPVVGFSERLAVVAVVGRVDACVVMAKLNLGGSAAVAVAAVVRAGFPRLG